MHNKKLKILIGALSICAVIVGGTFAWLSSSDSIINTFKIESKSPGIDIIEEFDQESAQKIKTGVNLDKKVQVQNKSNYDSLIRVSIEKLFVDSDGNALNNTSLSSEKIGLNYIEANKISEGDIDLDTQGNVTNLSEIEGKWFFAEDKYYYIGNVKPDGYTTQLLDSVNLHPSIASNPSISSNPNIKEIAFDVVVDAESVASTVEYITNSKDLGGFGLNQSKHPQLVAALKAVASGESKTWPKTVNPEKYQKEENNQ